MLNQVKMDLGGQNVVSMPVSAIMTNSPHSNGIVEMAEMRLRACAHRELRTLRCEYDKGVLILRGSVSSYYEKQLAQEVLRNLRGVDVIRNAVEVVSPHHS